MYNIDPDALVNIPCPNCGHKMPITVAVIQTSPHMPCEQCGAQFSINGQKVMEKIKAAQEQADLNRRRF